MNTILIANRGEIALRILRTARAMGFRCIAVYSDADAGAPHVRQADAACRIGAGPANASYLNMAAILRAAQEQGADAIHPGYGFLSENPDFAQAVLDAGLTWIGPPPAAMRAMGNKAGAKRLLAERDVPLLPGYQGSAQDDATLLREAERIGMPLMIKAAAGGGGRGMRLVQQLEAVAPALERARSEAAQAFGSGELILERALVAPRHVEVQVFADTYGNVVHMGERDCSVQRRHQKLIEEAPSPAVDPALRARLGAAAVQAASACGYVGAGTIEFLLDQDKGFWFMEMNTRLQVEHPVTEAITGLDLVEWQLRVAAGERLPLTQGQIDARLAQGGHAIEVRLCAEDPANDFLPQCGRIAVWHAPPELRVEHALANSSEVSPHYDSMLAKLIAHGADREEARRKLVRNLDDCRLLGLTSNQDFLLDCLRHDVFSAGQATTAFVDLHMPPEKRNAAEPAIHTRFLAAGLILSQRAATVAHRFPDELSGWASSSAFEDDVPFELDGQPCQVQARASGPNAWTLRVGDTAAQVEVEQGGETELRMRIDSGSVGEDTVHFARAGQGWHWRCRGRNHRVSDLAFLPARAFGAASGSGIVRAPMNGKVALLHVAVGDAVVAGAPLIVLEAMKMEHTISAPCDGCIDALHVGPGDQAAPGMVLANIRVEASK